jgi:predicted DNA-binding transcriptional regulator AlpA
MAKNDDPLLTECEAADYLNISKYWLQKVRSQGRPGPQVTHIGAAVRYRQSALDRYIEERSQVPERDRPFLRSGGRS